MFGLFWFKTNAHNWNFRLLNKKLIPDSKKILILQLSCSHHRFLKLGSVLIPWLPVWKLLNSSFFQGGFTNKTLHKPICRWFSINSIVIGSTRIGLGESVMATLGTINDVKKQHQLRRWHFTRFAQSVMRGDLNLTKSEQRLSVVGKLGTCHTSSIGTVNTAT